MIPLDVLIRADGELVASAQTAALEHSAPIGRSHALAKTMHAHTAADFGLICSLRHLLRSSLTYR